MRQKLRRLPASRRGEVWLHIDRFDKRGRAVWAVQYVNARGRSLWVTATRVMGPRLDLDTAAFFGKKLKQPRAYVRLKGARVRSRRNGVIYLQARRES